MKESRKREDINKILIVGAGPIVIGQACEFDYSGTQACKALRQEGYEIVLINSNPATIMTDTETADKVYIEPMDVPTLTKIIAKERPDALLPTLGGQTGLNLAMELANQGVLEKYNVEMLAADNEVIDRAEDRQKFKDVVSEIGLDSCLSEVAYTLEESVAIADKLGYPCVVRPAFTLGGTGGGIVHNQKELEDVVAKGLDASLISEVLIEESIIGWKEYELEVMRDKNDTAVIICSIENMDAMGVHTGDSITVAPVQTLTDKEYQRLRDASIAILRHIGVETGGSNVQFAINPVDGRMVVIEMNPRVSRSSALASKATGFPIAKFAARLATGDTLDNLQNDITKKTPACFEPTLDYVVTKIPRFNFEKFRETPPRLGTAMRSVGETMAIGRTFKESFQKALRGLENKQFGFGFNPNGNEDVSLNELITLLKEPNPNRVTYIEKAFRNGMVVEQLYEYTKIDPWFLNHMKQILDFGDTMTDDYDSIYQAKQMGFSDVQLTHILVYENEIQFRNRRKSLGIKPVYRLVDTCAGEFEAKTPYYYSTYETLDEIVVSDKPKVMILGGGPNRIGQGIEFDYCCVHASMAAKEMGYETIMVNCNPETVSTDFDTSDKLYFEPLTLENVLDIYEKEQPEGVIIQFGGQTPLNLALELKRQGVHILGTSPESIDLAEDRDKFKKILNKLNLKQPQNAIVYSKEESITEAEKIGYPIVIRPSYVLGGASMEICYSKEELVEYISHAKEINPEHPILLDKFLDNAIELDVDALANEDNRAIAGIMEHIEPCGIHSGDSACILPTKSVSSEMIREIREATYALARELHVVGLMNIQFAVQDEQLFLIEVNPRGSRTVPFVSKSTNVQWAKMATRVMLGKSFQELGIVENLETRNFNVKEAVLPFNKFNHSDPVLGPEMRSTGEVMGIDPDPYISYYKAQLASGTNLPSEGSVAIRMDKLNAGAYDQLEESFSALGFDVLTRDINNDELLDRLNSGGIDLFINTPSKNDTVEKEWRKACINRRIPMITTIRAAEYTSKAIAAVNESDFEVSPLDEYFGVKSEERVGHSV
ncbi:MAG: carbamoyl-phosphate synthase large subunit [Leptolyngbya sp. SIO3F4]|nr:carbamoyl-phosphate synthase large subunit [Leptolyngbya sp. SIO3F4]